MLLCLGGGVGGWVGWLWVRRMFSDGLVKSRWVGGWVGYLEDETREVDTEVQSRVGWLREAQVVCLFG